MPGSRKRPDFSKRIGELLREAEQYGGSDYLDELTGGIGGSGSGGDGYRGGNDNDEDEPDPYKGPSENDPENEWRRGDYGTGVLEDEPYSDIILKVIFRDLGYAHIRPIRSDEAVALAYGTAVRGYLQDGNKKHSAGYYGNQIHGFEGRRISGILPNGRIVKGERLETSLGKIKRIGRAEPELAGRNVWRQVGGS